MNTYKPFNMNNTFKRNTNMSINNTNTNTFLYRGGVIIITDINLKKTKL